ncbi:NAD-dependent epimerase/dehydratase family protein [Azohydromonas aeria]|uniref:NAD-dependent epimerase/dehydratase family protein n=1 Tax=Azohydromonas aeria TaxID=2590212 RepID=UPI0012FA06E2|nr:NAD-dependent epimerase/dehydratase family protein [Azohydromonas aeria]
MNTPSTPSTVLILGANGRIGLAAAQAFAAAGWQVLAQVRRDAVPGMPPSARLLRVPVDDVAALAAQAAGAGVLVHALNMHYARWEREAMPLLSHALDLAQALGARLMLPGNVYNYGLNLSVPTPEDAPQRPHTRHGRVRVAMEAEIERRCRAGALRATVLTAGDFYGGDGTGTAFDLVILRSLARGRLTYPGPLDVPHAWAYLPDLGRAFVALAEAPALPDFFRCHFAGHTLTGAQVLDAVESAAAALGLRPAAGFKRGGLPWGLIRVLGLAVPLLRALADMSYLWRVPHGLDDARLQSVLGDRVPHTAPDAALLETVRAWARAEAARATGAPRGQAA